MVWSHEPSIMGYSISSIMQPFRNLVKPNTKFHWDSTLEQLYQNSKELILSAVTEGIQSIDPTRPICLQTDWSKTGIGYLLLQKYYQCKTSTTPIDGRRLVLCRLLLYLKKWKANIPL